jgi:RNA polymerase sigma-70 factor (ECF subfamily)
MGMATGVLRTNVTDLVCRCIAGDDAARAEFISIYDPLIRRAISRRIQRTAAARANAAHIEDIAHEVYVRLFADQCRALQSVRHADRIDAWLVTVAHNHVVGYLRKNHRAGASLDVRLDEMPAPLEHAPDNRAIANELVQRLSSCLARLEPKDRLVLQLFYVSRLRYVDISRTLNMNINTVASRISRAKERLREFMQEGLA